MSLWSLLKARGSTHDGSAQDIYKASGTMYILCIYTVMYRESLKYSRNSWLVDSGKGTPNLDPTLDAQPRWKYRVEVSVDPVWSSHHHINFQLNYLSRLLWKPFFFQKCKFHVLHLNQILNLRAVYGLPTKNCCQLFHEVGGGWHFRFMIYLFYVHKLAKVLEDVRFCLILGSRSRLNMVTRIRPVVYLCKWPKTAAHFVRIVVGSYIYIYVYICIYLYKLSCLQINRKRWSTPKSIWLQKV